MITNFPAKRSYNTGGYSRLWFAPSRLISAIPLPAKSIISSPVTFLGTNTWLTGYATKGTLLLREEPQTDANGTYYLKSITGFAPGDDPALVNLMAEMADDRFIIVLNDRFGRQRLVGNLTVPLDFSSIYDSGSKTEDEKGFRFTFKCADLLPSPYYQV